MTPIQNFLDGARNNLIDNTLRNRFLNYRETKRRSITIAPKNPLDIYSAVVIKERDFHPKPKMEEGEQAGLVDEADQGPYFLHSDHTREDLIRRLTHCNRDARSILEEQGYNALYLALFFLRWSESPASQHKLLAPLLLVPVRLDRIRGAFFKGRWTKEEVQINESVRLKLREQGIELPVLEKESQKAVQEYVGNVKSLVKDQENWCVENLAYLDFFNFTKVVMWKDLDPQAWPKEHSPLEHRVLAVLSRCRRAQEGLERFPEGEVDRRLNLRETYYVMDADPSQIAVIEDVKAGHSLVVEGPPGTGKSQTIVNLIGELLAQNKKVLFVSEKLAALDVVKKRLDKVGLGDFCLELHSRKADRKAFLEEMRKALDFGALSEVPKEGLLSGLESSRDRLNDYVDALRKPFGALGKSPFELMCMREEARTHFRRYSKDEPSLEMDGAVNCAGDQWNAIIDALAEIRGVLADVGSVPDHPFYGCSPDESGHATYALLEQLTGECRAAGEELLGSLNEWTERGLGSLPDSWEEIPQLIEASSIICRSLHFRPLDREVLARRDPQLEKSEAFSLIKRAEDLQDKKSRLESTFNGNAFKSDKSLLLGHSKALLDNWYMLFHPIKHWCLKEEVFALYKAKSSKPLHEVVQDLNGMVDYLEAKAELDELSSQGKHFFGLHWKAENSDCHKLGTLWDWLECFQSLRRKGVISDAAVDVVCSKLDSGLLKSSARRLQDAWSTFPGKYRHLIEILNPNYEKIFGNHHREPGLSDLITRLRVWESGLPRWHEWPIYLDTVGQLSRTLASPLATLIECGSLGPGDLIPAFEGNVARAMLKRAVEERRALKNFLTGAHEDQISRFAELDTALTTLNKKRLPHRLFTLRHQTIAKARPKDDPAFVLKKEIAKKKKHLSLRQLFSKTGGFIQQLKPCVMMSPLSVAQFLEPGKPHFDVVVFDEASQVRPADGLGAILRGDQLVVIGDSRQLPPTDFFERVLEGGVETDSDTGDDLALHDMDSLLDLCRVVFDDPGQLKWHYRSEHESLIAVSNQEFYNNSLKVYPSPVPRNETLGLSYVKVPGGKYDRGRSRTNLGEAQAVAQAVNEHCTCHPELSLGVGTFNEAQRECILEELERMCEEHRRLKEFLNPDHRDPFFVKNLETIQGDERDVIFISIGYGFDLDGRFSLNFGPLNQQGGERRLNVLISRARKKCVVFANFDASNLNLAGSNSRGVQALKVFLDYAEMGNLSSITPGGFDSPFEAAVHDFLAQHGFETVPQVGTAGYRIDLAVPHPTMSRHYVLGIECDGRKYHSSSVARERDRLRAQVLAERGWKLHRVWSTDWYHSRPLAEQKILEAVKSAIEKAKRHSAKSEESGEDFTRPSPSDGSGNEEQSLESLPSSHRRDSEMVDIPFDEDIRDALLRMIYDNNEELHDDESLVSLREYKFAASKWSEDSAPPWPREFRERIEWALNDLAQEGYLDRADTEIWKITGKGKHRLFLAGLVEGEN